MNSYQTESGFAPIDGALIYYEIAGEGTPFLMIHAGVADHRQWDHEYTHFAHQFRVMRYDMRGYGRSKPVAGEFSHLKDLTALMDHLRIDQPVLVMGCSMGGGVALNLALSKPSSVKALILVDSGPPGLELDLPDHPKTADAEQAYLAGDLDLACELETQIWFDGMGRSPEQVDQTVRKLVYDMNRTGLAHDAKHLGNRLPDSELPASQRLDEINVPVLVIVGAHDTPYMHAAADYIIEKIKSARKEIIESCAHLPNLEQPEEFRRIILAFLEELTT